MDGHTQIRQAGFLNWSLIHSRYARALIEQQLDCRYAAARHPDHYRPCSLQFHRSFKVVSANRAITRPAIQNRMITLDSAQPSASK